eukprot:GEMP01036779.1.p1 GENE.GEMP01036779.1~~GEMP01036779.1.p1  ORF type:complete len:414 (+),score=76.53 GEMP01036779.1:349-1590(+)
MVFTILLLCAARSEATTFTSKDNAELLKYQSQAHPPYVPEVVSRNQVVTKETVAHTTGGKPSSRAVTPHVASFVVNPSAFMGGMSVPSRSMTGTHLPAHSSLDPWNNPKTFSGVTASDVRDGKDKPMAAPFTNADGDVKALRTEWPTDSRFQRVTVQDTVVLVTLLIVYLILIFSGLTLVYLQSCNDSPILFFTDQRYHNLSTEDYSTDRFFDAFNTFPSRCSLRVTGFRQTPLLSSDAVTWRGCFYRPDLSLCFDLNHEWMSALPVEPEAVATAESFLASGTTGRRALECLTLEKKVQWNEWEELACNIKKRMKSLGYLGIIDVQFDSSDSIRVYKNSAWSIFLHHETTATLMALSIVGSLWYFPYMLWSRRKHACTTKFVVNCPINEFWTLIQARLQPPVPGPPVEGSIVM